MDYLPGEWRAAFVVKGVLQQLLIHRPYEQQNRGALSGDLYWGRVRKINPSIGAAFVDLGPGPDGFLPLKGPAAALTEGEYRLFGIKHPARDTKGPVLSLHYELKSHDLVLTPTKAGLNLSKNLTNRDFLKDGLSPHLSDQVGWVIRSSAQHRPLEALIKQAEELWARYQNLIASENATVGVAHQSDLFFEKLHRFIDHYDIAQAQIDDPVLRAHLPPDLPAHLFSNTGILFEHAGLEEQIEQLGSPLVKIPGGGNMAIEQTRALTTVDIDWANRVDQKKTEAQVLQFNLTALSVLKHQLTLRQIGGQIVIDFLKLSRPTSRKQLHDAVIATFADHPDITGHGLSRLGLGELSSAHQGPSLLALITQETSGFYQLCRRTKTQRLSKPLAVPLRMWERKDEAGLKETVTWLENRCGLSPLFLLTDKEDPHAP